MVYLANFYFLICCHRFPLKKNFAPDFCRSWRIWNLCPITTAAAWVKDQAWLAILLISVSILTVPESIFVVGHRVETISFASTKSTAAARAAATTRAAATARASTTASTTTDWGKRLGRRSAAWNKKGHHTITYKEQCTHLYFLPNYLFITCLRNLYTACL